MAVDFRKSFYEFMVRATIIIHFIILLLYFIAVPILFMKGLWSWLSAAYIIITWAQYRFLDGCIITFAENYFLKKLGRKTHKHFVSRQLSRLLNGQFKGDDKKQEVDRISWNIKTFFFIIAMIVVLVKLLFGLP